MYKFYRHWLSLLFSSTLLLANPGAFADRSYSTDDDDDCLSRYAIYKLVKQSLPQLQALDATVSYVDVIRIIKSTGVCVTAEAAKEALAEYAESLTGESELSNTPPQITGTPDAYSAEGKAYSFTPTAYDADNNSLSFKIVNQPNWASFNSTTGTLSGTPGYTDAGNYDNIIISVSDGQASASLTAFSITINDTNRPPSISGTPAAAVQEGNNYSFNPTASDSDGDKLVFRISGLPAWASFDTANGALTGTPGFTDAGSYSSIVISVSDGKATTSLSSFNIVVENTNRPPTLSGDSEASVTAGEVFTYTPSTTDPDGDNLRFSITNLPLWAVFESTTGTLSGIPGTTDIGIYEDIVITVSDGSVSATSITLSVMVIENPSHSGSAALHWEIPTTRTDGTPLALSEIEGYRIYMGTSSETLEMIVDLNDGSETSYSITGLANGSYYFTVTTYDTDGNESSYSNIAMKNIL